MNQMPSTPTTPDGRDTRWTDHRFARRQQLLHAAVELIDANGTDIGVQAIATAASMPRSVVYKLFKDREDLDEQIRAHIVRNLNRTMAPTLVPRGTGRQTIARGVKAYVTWVTNHPHLHEFLLEGSSSRPAPTGAGSSALQGGRATFAQQAQALIEAGMGTRSLARGAAANLTHALLGMADATVNAWQRAGSRERTSSANLVLFVTESASALIEASARLAGVQVDLDAPLDALPV